jgi:putative DNA primase/helicase
LLTLIEETFTDDYSERMIARTLDNMQALLANIRIFQRAARKTLGGARASEQIGTMLAGLYLLGRTDVVTEEKAIEFVASHNWSDHTTVEHDGDPVRLVQHISSSLVRMNGGTEISIGDLIGMVINERDAMAAKALKNYGIIVKEGRVFIASTSHNMARLLKDTDWRVKWSRTLSDVPGAQKEKCVYFARGIKTSAISLPISMFTDEDEPQQVMEYDNRF